MTNETVITQIPVPTDITVGMITSLIVSAHEGGSNYWLEEYDTVEPKNWDTIKETWKDREGEEHVWYYCYPLNEGGKLLYKTDDMEKDDEPLVLDLETIKKTFVLMMGHENSRIRGHAMDVALEQADADTADVFIQMALFGKVVYG